MWYVQSGMKKPCMCYIQEISKKTTVENRSLDLMGGEVSRKAVVLMCILYAMNVM